jgi:hypothetical protein
VKWNERVFKTNDVCVGDVNEFKTVEYWESKKFRTKEVEPNDTIEREKDIAKTTFTRGEIDKNVETGRNLNWDLEPIKYMDKKGYIRNRFRIKK